jgi:hypothetical protein
MPCSFSTTGGPPAAWVQADSFTWQTSAPDYPSTSGWTLKTFFQGTTDSIVTLDGVSVAGSPTLYGFSMDALQTLSLPAGPIVWQIRAQRGFTENAVILSGRSTACPSIGSEAFSALTPAERMLAALEAIGPQIAASGYASMTVDGVLVQFRSLDEYFRALAAARDLVAAEKNSASCVNGCAGSGGNRRRVLVRFSPL